MYQIASVNLLNLLLSLSDALDLASPTLSQHQMRTAFIAWEMSKAANLSRDMVEQVFIAALFHDVGALSPEDKINLHNSEDVDVEPHCILGAAFLKHVPIFEPSSKLVRFHHKPWEKWENTSDASLIFPSQILYLSDAVERLINRNKYILHQDEEIISTINSWSSKLIHPRLVEIFKSVAYREDFWLDTVSTRLYSLLLHNGPCKGTELSISDLIAISEMFRNLIDFRSPFTATHSSGVAVTASAIARFIGLTDIEIEFMEVAGNLHDLGKMAIPNSILNKPGKLTRDEFAVMRQHTYFTYTVLNTIGGIRHIAEWAAFHHEKLDGTGYPFHLNASKLDMGTRIMAVADIFTALAEDRPYRPSMKKNEIIDVLHGLSCRNALDKTIVDILVHNYDVINETTAQRQSDTNEFYRLEFAVGQSHAA
jgi:HD-GYP domain-containing protein (c-di-GMP phosphodiesterase class II)